MPTRNRDRTSTVFISCAQRLGGSEAVGDRPRCLAAGEAGSSPGVRQLTEGVPRLVRGFRGRSASFDRTFSVIDRIWEQTPVLAANTGLSDRTVQPSRFPAAQYRCRSARECGMLAARGRGGGLQTYAISDYHVPYGWAGEGWAFGRPLSGVGVLAPVVGS